MAFTNCCFFYGIIHLEDCVGVNITGGSFACSIDTTGSPKAKSIAGNYLHNNWNDMDYTFKFSPATILQDNFDPDGPWALDERGK